ncbi:MAG: GNAT family N-acetyltransferase [Actinobacteria bacterium]|nr:GNAT family N-acetyltransferase [Actinomycetota bacterium]
MRLAYELAREGYADMPLVEPVEVSLEEWLREEATLPGGSFAALVEGELVGYAGLLALGADPGAAEHGLTVVRRDRRRCGLATALKRRQLAWAAASGLRELVTWTQRGNEGMRRVNELLGYRLRSESLTMRGPVASLARPPASLAAVVPASS